MGAGTSGQQFFNVSGLFQAWLNDPASNQGVVLRLVDETDFSAVVGQDSSAANAIDRPTLRLTYIECDPVAGILDLIQMVEDLNLQNGIENSLDAKLNAAVNALVDMILANDGAAIGALDAFINAVNAQAGNQIPTDDAADLSNDAENVILQLVCE